MLVAPPGAGKTTLVPLALADEPWAAGGKLIVLEPRRLAARAAAARMAQLLGERVGESVGYRVRLETRVGPRTRIEVVTEGVFTRMILADPALEGVAAVLFDEFHERSLDADLGLAFARDAQGLLREDLRLLVMSATLDGAAVAALLDDAPVIESAGRAYPVETRYVGRDAQAPLEPQAARVIVRALEAAEGDVLAFLPGQGEIARTAERLAPVVDDEVDIRPLHGGLDLPEQQAAIAPSPPGRRKVVLATSIAQTSLTLEGVRIVVDSGLARVPRWDVGAGVTRLVTTPVSRASADQRRGRAGRTAPGVCWRMWDEPQTRGLPPFDRPEILETDLTRLVLDVARWGGSPLEDLALLDRPPAGALAEARRLLVTLGALDEEGRLTARGRSIAVMPLPPRLAHLVAVGAETGAGARAARLAAVLSERGLGGRDIDAARRVEALSRDRSPRARAALAMADRWTRDSAVGRSGTTPETDGLLLARAFPERIARRRGEPGAFLLANGRGAWMEPAQALADEPWLAVAELVGGAARDRITLAAPLSIDALRATAPELFTVTRRLTQTPSGERRAARITHLGEIEVERREGPAEPAEVREALLEEIAREGLSGLPWSEGTVQLRERLAFLRRIDPQAPDLSDTALLTRLDTWLAPLLEGVSGLAQVPPSDLDAAVRALVPWEVQARLDREAPERFHTPAGTSHPIDYAGEGAPRVRVRVQELFGLTTHPSVAGAPLALALLSPAHREIQVTRDLPRFWAGSWADVRKEMRGRYPRHPWPEDPAQAPPTTRAKPRA